MKKTTLLGVMAMLCLLASAQQATIKPLTVGDTVPNIFWELPFQLISSTGERKTIQLNQFKNNDLIILDFWATWCAPCVRELPKMQQLQSDFAGSVKILPVNEATHNDSVHIVERFLLLKKLNLPSVYGQYNLLQQLFPHIAIPHCVIINSQGRLLAITESRYINHQNIDAYLNGKAFSLPLKVELDTSALRNLPQSSKKIKEAISSSLYYKVPGMLGTYQRIENDRFIMTRSNSSLPLLYLAALQKPSNYTKRLRFENIEDNWWRHPKTEDAAIIDDWENNHLYTYENNLPVSSKDYRFEKMRMDLELYMQSQWGIKVTVAEREADVLLLTRYKGQEQPIIQDRENKVHRFRWTNTTIDKIIQALDSRVGNRPIISGLGEAVKVSLDLQVNNLEDFNEVVTQLHKNGLDLLPARQRIELIMFSKTDSLITKSN